MTDISREKLEALTDDIYQVLKDSGNLSGTFLSGAKTFKEAIKCHLKLDTLDADPWIPVSTPPKKMDRYRVYISTKDELYQTDAIYSEPHGGWIEPTYPRVITGVTHWAQHLPTPVEE